MAAKRRYDIAPDPTLMEDIGATSFTVAEAIAELVANSMDARIEAKPLTIDVLVSPAEIRVTDDGKGMTEEILAEAVRLGVKMDSITKNTKARKGMFGLGMKTACASLGRHWAVVTRPSGTNHEYSVEFDLAEWRKQAGSKTFKWAVEIAESAPNKKGPLGNREHGTAVIIKNLRESNPMAGPVLEKLGQAYKPHLETGDSIRVNGESAEPKSFDFIDNSKVDIDLEVGPQSQYRISGWVALDKRTHNDDKFGLNLYRQGQLVEAWNKDWFKVHLMTSRIIGEVNLDFVPVNFHKKGFETQSPEWKLATAEMSEFLKPVAKASRDMAIGRNDAGRVVRAVEGLQRAMGHAPTLELGPEPAGGDGGAWEPTVPYVAEGKPVDVDPNTLVLGDSKIRLAFTLEDMQTEEVPWDYLYDDSNEELQAVVNTSSRLFQKVKDESFLGTLALADAVASFLVNERGMSFKLAREIRDRWLFVSVGAE